MKKRIHIIFIFVFAIGCLGQLFAQVSIDKEIRFVSSDSSLRTIIGIVLSSDPTSGLPKSVFVESDLNYSEAISGGSVLNIAVPVMITSYFAGFELFIKAAAANPGQLFLNVNGLGNIEVMLRDSVSLLSNQISSGQVFRVIFNGTYFILNSPIESECPTGFVSVNDVYCIEIDDRPLVPYLVAVNTCYSINAKLCTWGEWYYACQKSSLGLNNMTNNYEFLDDTSDHTNTVQIVGNGSCTVFSTYALANTGGHRYRCCYNK